MFKRSMFLLVMVAAIGLPYLVTSSPDWWNHLTSGSTRDTKTSTTAVGFRPGAWPAAPLGRSQGAANQSLGQPPPVEGFGAADLGEVLQFEGTPAWVMARWPRVTAGLAELDLQGYRVPLVSGTAEDDIAGSLTYYFDKDQRTAWIGFHGTTGDPRKLVALLTSRYRFVAQQAKDPSLHLYQVKRNGKPQSELRIRPARVVRADQPHARYEVDLEMKRP